MELRKINSKGQMGMMSDKIITLGIAAIVLVLMLVILQELRSNNLVSASQTETGNNETLANVTEIPSSLSLGQGRSGVANVITFTSANTTNLVIQAGNFTVSGLEVSFDHTDGDTRFNGTAINVTYTSTHGGDAFVSANRTLVGVGTFGDFWTIIVLAIVAGIVLTIVFTLFGRPEKR